MRAFFTDRFAIPVPPGHRFPVGKYRRLRERLLDEHVLHAAALFEPEPVCADELSRAHADDYVSRMLAGYMTDREMRRIGFPWSEALVERSCRSCGGTLAAARAALTDGIAVNLAGGTHHACYDHGEGFCVFNDTVVAARALQASGEARRILVVDLDVHQGNGTAEIAAGDETIYTFSMHGEGNYPVRKSVSDLDIALADATGDEDYLDALRMAWEKLAEFRADLVIYIAGADPYASDRLGRLALTKEGLRQRDEIVVAACRAAHIPLAVTLGGGYAQVLEDIVDIHLSTVHTAKRMGMA